MPGPRYVGDPPESTQLRIGDGVTRSDINGVYDRDDSLKENTNPKCLLKPNTHNHGHHHTSTTSSQRFSGNLKPTAAPIIGLPGKLRGIGGGGARRQQHHHHHHAPAMFPKKQARTGGVGRNAKPAAAGLDPASPKVSCFGKVGSQRERQRALRQLPPAPAPRVERPPGCCGGLGFLTMRRSRSWNSAVDCIDQSPPPVLAPPPSSAVTKRREVNEEVPVPGLGGMQRFSSGRRAADWAAEMEDDRRVVRSGPL